MFFTWICQLFVCISQVCRYLQSKWRKPDKTTNLFQPPAAPSICQNFFIPIPSSLSSAELTGEPIMIKTKMPSIPTMNNSLPISITAFANERESPAWTTGQEKKNSNNSSGSSRLIVVPHHGGEQPLIIYRWCC